MKKIFIFMLCLLSLNLFADDLANKKTEELPALAVIDFEPKGVKENISEFLTEQIRMEIFKIGKYKLLERSKIADILNEQKMQLNGLTGSTYTLKVGELLAANYILTGNMSKIGDKVYINSKLVDVQSGVMKWGNTYEIRSENELVAKAKQIAEDLIDNRVSTDKSDIKKNDREEIKTTLNSEEGTDKNTEIVDNLGKVGVSVGNVVNEAVNYFIQKAREREIEEKKMIQPEVKKVERKEIKQEKIVLVRVGPKFEKSRDQVKYEKYGLASNMIWMGGFVTVGKENGFSFGGAGAGGRISSSLYDLSTGYGGPMLSINRKIGLIRLNGDLLIGAGGYSIDDQSLKKDDDSYTAEKSLEKGAFFVAQPGVRLGIEPFNFFEVGAAYSYLYSGLDSTKFSLSSSNIGVYFAFGY